MDVYRERVVAPDQPPEFLFEALVVGLVDDLLLPPVPDRVRPASPEDPAQTLCMSEQNTPARDEVGDDPSGLFVHARVRLDLAVYELSGEQVRGLESQDLLRPEYPLGCQSRRRAPV